MKLIKRTDLERLIYLIEYEFAQYSQTEYMCGRCVYADELRNAIKRRIFEVREDVKNRELISKNVKS